MPYAFINTAAFIKDIALQTKMNSDPYIFPYTLQYVNSLPYFYYLKNIFLWGLGPIISILSLIGGFKLRKFLFSKYFLFFLFYLIYFLIIGRSAVKFMRYMLPIYPFLSIIAGYGVSQITNNRYLIILILLFSSFWTLMFVNIYSNPHTRIAATNWILKNIPPGTTLATEHWDDGLPLTKGENYKHVELTLYDQPDSQTKWLILDNKLKQTDYIIIASNRLYVPLQKLANCNRFKLCFPSTTKYYQELFAGKLGFKKIAEFAVYPGFQIFGFKFQISDQGADESFTVYDHPKIMIYKKLSY